ncbi:hypothetical protein [Micromonospora sp. LOL_021]|uniref:hypothetical protein n=1 Tax=Micromonospora sp. LOL_021 TaxID=3345417 RepID=UPI003A85508D
MSQTRVLDLKLDRRWRLQVTWGPRRLLREDYVESIIVDSDHELRSQLMSLASDPWVQDIHCERYYGTWPARRYRTADC